MSRKELEKAYQEYCDATKAAFAEEGDFYINKYISPELEKAFKLAKARFFELQKRANQWRE